MKNRLLNTGLVILFILAIGLRCAGLQFVSRDMSRDFMLWYRQLADGGYPALSLSSFSYTPPYLYLLFLSTLTGSFLPALVAIKLIPLFFDLCNAFIIYKIVRLQYPSGRLPILAAAVFALAPSVILNSAYWGQVDSFFTCFLLLCLYYVLKDKPLPAVLFFGIAFTIKAQAVFLAPFLALLVFKKRLPWLQFGLIPIVYLVLCLPVVLLGKSLFSTASIYAAQAGGFSEASMNAPNWYIFVRPGGYSSALVIGLSAAALLGLVWLFIYARRKFELSHARLVFLALVSLACVPFILPRMHERYLYPADVFSILLAFFLPELWFVAVGYQIVSVLTYGIYLFQQGVMPNLVLATALNTVLVLILLIKQDRLTRPKPGQDPV